MIEIKTEIEIEAPIEKVWAILTDFNNWQGWNPTVKRTSGEAKLGSKLDITMRSKGPKDGPTYKPIITELEAPKHFRFRASMLSSILMRNEKLCQLERSSDGNTKLTHSEFFSGLMPRLMCAKLESGVPIMLKMMNKALKKKAEN